MTKRVALGQVPRIVSLALQRTVAWVGLALAVGAGCSFRGGDFTPMAKEPETPCSKEAEAICKEKLGSADIGNCVARERYRCELLEQEGQTKSDSEPAPKP